MEREIDKIVGNFRIEGNLQGWRAVTTGHINDSFLIEMEGDHPGYFLQWVNGYIFKDVHRLMKNIELVTNHISRKHKAQTGHSDVRVLELVRAADGRSYYKDPQGEYWRMYINIPGTHVYDIVTDETIAYEGGKAFGRFISDLTDLSVGCLSETIPNFHNIEYRLQNYYASLDADKRDRRKDIEAEIRFIEERKAQMLRIPELIRQGLIKPRITHNDTKFNNILFNRENKAICVVDLDTVMPGSVLFDFGDAIRTTANTTCEDEKDLEKVDINLKIYEAYTRGFIKSTRNSLSKDEIENLAFATRYMTFIIGLRFITDFLDGDPYFRTHYPTHNLDRARVQFRLIEAMERNADAMEEIVNKACKNCISKAGN